MNKGTLGKFWLLISLVILGLVITQGLSFAADEDDKNRPERLVLMAVEYPGVEITKDDDVSMDTKRMKMSRFGSSKNPRDGRLESKHTDLMSPGYMCPQQRTKPSRLKPSRMKTCNPENTSFALPRKRRMADLIWPKPLWCPSKKVNPTKKNLKV
jgi:hypothetical protein